MAPARTLTNSRGESRGKRGPVPHLVRLLSYEHPHEPSTAASLAKLDEVLLVRGESTHFTYAYDKGTLTFEVNDARMSSKHARLHERAGEWIIEDLGSRNGTFVDEVRKDVAALTDGSLIETGRTAFLFRMLVHGATGQFLPGVSTFSPTFAEALDAARRVAASRQSILIHGETGTGKEVVARGIHAASRRSGPFIAVNCGALPDTLVESELFGAKKGAFSGATEDRQGLVRSADGGTLFLDEIGDLALPAQAALLRVLQEGEVLPIGASRPTKVDVRVVAATHRDLEEDVEAQRFREDLLARLAGFVVEVPPLRERREDLGLLIGTLLSRHDAPKLTFSPEAGRALLRYNWPRNVRELEQALSSAIALAEGHTVELAHLPPVLKRHSTQPDAEDLAPSDIKRRDELRTLLAKHKGNVAAVARAMRVARMQIHRWIDRYAIDLGSYR